jgi:DNA-binding HxlR family transcriptional regulator
MTSRAIEENLEARAALFSALGHPMRLLIVNLVHKKPRHGEELAAILYLKPATVSHHLAKLSEVGLLRSEKDQYYQVYSLVPEVLSPPLRELVLMRQPSISQQVQEDAYRQKVLKTFLVHGRLKQLPAQLKKRQVILEHLVEVFEPERDYSEKEVTVLLLDFSDDPVTLRRLLVDQGLLQREHGTYRRIARSTG